MSNPSTIWAQLSLPNPPIGAIPFVGLDSASIVTDVVNFFYTQAGVVALVGSQQTLQLSIFGGVRVGYSDVSAAPGNATINKTAGRAAFAAAATTVVITSSYAFATSIVDVNLETADGTLTRVTAVAANGSITFTGNAAATGITKFTFMINNVY